MGPNRDRRNADDNKDERVSIDQAIRLAMELHKQSKLDQAEGLYREVLAVVPNHPDALHFLGLMHYQRGRVDEAIQAITCALAVAPEYVDAHNNLGNIHMEHKRFKEAEECYRRTVELAPGHLGALNNLGSVLRARGRPEEAEPVFRKALTISEDFFPLHYNLGNLLCEQGKVAEAVDHLFQAIVLDPEQADSKVMLGIALMTLGRKEEAVEHYRRWLKEDPHNPEALHLLAACSDGTAPDRASDNYVKSLFDRFADSFEDSLNVLGYRAPQLVSEALELACGKPKGTLDILDAGCGTGLCGPLLQPYSRKLDGVDLSEGMLNRARRTQSYHRLEEAELSGYLNDCKEEYDVIVSADTLCYFGELQTVFAAAGVALKKNGHFIFTVELADDLQAGENGNYRILPQGRYAHTESYLRQTARQFGLAPLRVQREVLRQEMGRPVKGLVVTLVPT
ncbi:tetratricopeptide repeat protein [uncultured Desulfosarcina sp.]|uniref:tetratricopeptide repeat protein n=1 Tax=uncultured Desulfosarcina sp. TaxID=218289 RepID=UPI0029C6D0C0|nr:tetratricopeptide repeat protein [uncultured Desulfosarcina sp.]